MKNAGTAQTKTETARPDTLKFGEFRIDLPQRVLFRGAERVRIQRKPLAVLIHLIQQAPRMVPREELLQKFWSRAVNEESLTRCISTIRTLLGDNKNPPEFLETHHAQGYRFIAEVARSGANDVPAGRRSRSRRLGVAAAFLILASVVLLATRFIPGGKAPGPSPETINRLAVMPVVVEYPEEPWLERALTDHVMRAVSRVEGITVVASGPASGVIEPQEQGNRLNVQALLLTRLEAMPKGSRMSARLVATDDGALLWQSSFASTDAIVSSSQVEKLARQVAVRLRPALQLRDQKKQVDEPAYAAYLRGRYYWSQRSAVGLEAAIVAFNEALEINPDYADAMLGAAESWLLLPLYGAMSPMEAIPSARALSQRVLDEDPHNARARAVLGVIAMQFDWNWLAAESLLRESVALNPNDATAQQWLGELYCYQSRFDDCRRQLRIALELDPLSPVLLMQQGTPALYSGDFDAATAAYKTAMENSPQFALGRYALGLACAGLGDWDRAIAAYETSLPDLGLAIVGGPLIYALSKSGKVAAANMILERLEALAETRYVPPSKLAVAYLGIGDKERAVASLQLAVDTHDDRLVYYANDVHFRDLLGESGFREIAERLGFTTQI
jgi:serine/threonine-protein kinase